MFFVFVGAKFMGLNGMRCDFGHHGALFVEEIATFIVLCIA